MAVARDIHYIDSSVILRYAINHTDSIKDLSRYAYGATTSIVTAIECLRVLDRWRLTREVSEVQLVDARLLCRQILSGLSVVMMDEHIARLAAQSFPIAIKSLDAIHLATALMLSQQDSKRVKLLTHDTKLALAARSMDLEVVI